MKPHGPEGTKGGLSVCLQEVGWSPFEGELVILRMPVFFSAGSWVRTNIRCCGPALLVTTPLSEVLWATLLFLLMCTYLLG